MTQSPRDDAPLVQPEGVNAGSVDQASEAGPRDIPRVNAGGDPEDAPDPSQGLTGDETEKDPELVGTPGGERTESGQDSGSMD
jgi:hypothetical protein